MIKRTKYLNMPIRKIYYNLKCQDKNKVLKKSYSKYYITLK